MFWEERFDNNERIASLCVKQPKEIISLLAILTVQARYEDYK
jgi:hypothetical protein